MARVIYKSAEGVISFSDYGDEIDILESETLVPNKTRLKPSVSKNLVITPTDIPKDKLYLTLHQAFEQGVIPILYDKNITSIKPRVEALDFTTIPTNTSAIFFTSGTTGTPTGALKSKESITKELEVLKELFTPLGIERVVVTVPLIHIYGFLAGVLLPRALDAEVVLKEEFLPHELLELAEDKKTLCITNPVFLKVLNKLNITKKYPNITFLSSTGKLDAKVANSLHQKLNVTTYQLFGSTETGGIAYKIDDNELWQPLSGVKIAKEGENLSVNSPFISDFLIEESLVNVQKPFITTDIIEIVDNSFRLIGRASEIIKISGKRISILEVETLLEQSRAIDEALVKLSYDVASHKDEQLEILVVSSMELRELRGVVKKILQKNYKNINIRTTLQKVESIATNHIGKKLRG